MNILFKCVVIFAVSLIVMIIAYPFYQKRQITHFNNIVKVDDVKLVTKLHNDFIVLEKSEDERSRSLKYFSYDYRKLQWEPKLTEDVYLDSTKYTEGTFPDGTNYLLLDMPSGGNAGFIYYKILFYNKQLLSWSSDNVSVKNVKVEGNSVIEDDGDQVTIYEKKGDRFYITINKSVASKAGTKNDSIIHYYEKNGNIISDKDKVEVKVGYKVILNRTMPGNLIRMQLSGDDCVWNDHDIVVNKPGICTLMMGYNDNIYIKIIGK